MVRMEVAERLASGRLAIFVGDPDLRVRFTAVERIDPEYLPIFLRDQEAIIRDLVTQRMRDLGVPDAALEAATAGPEPDFCAPPHRI